MIDGLRVYDDFLPAPEVYRAAALRLEYRTFEFPGETFHGIAMPAPEDAPAKIARMFPDMAPSLSFLRRSPAGQIEPDLIHTDIGMGEWTGILYLNPKPPAGDGTAFWVHRETGERSNAEPHLRSADGLNPALWKRWRLVRARFNRLLMFPATYFHSRAIAENWGEGDNARLVQVVFGRYETEGGAM
jgi:hypothetical protein